MLLVVTRQVKSVFDRPTVRAKEIHTAELWKTFLDWNRKPRASNMFQQKLQNNGFPQKF